MLKESRRKRIGIGITPLLGVDSLDQKTIVVKRLS